jgi:hypothetical protein
LPPSGRKSIATFDYAVGQGVSLLSEITAVTIREGNPVETLLRGEYVVKYRMPYGVEGVMQVLPYS